MAKSDRGGPGIPPSRYHPWQLCIEPDDCSYNTCFNRPHSALFELKTMSCSSVRDMQLVNVVTQPSLDILWS